MIKEGARTTPYWLLATNEAIEQRGTPPISYRPLNPLEALLSVLTEYVSSGHRAYPGGVYGKVFHRRPLFEGEKSCDMNIYIGDFREGVLNVRYVKAEKNIGSKIVWGREIGETQASSSSSNHSLLNDLEDEFSSIPF